MRCLKLEYNLQNYTIVKERNKENRKAYLLYSIAIWVISSIFISIFLKENVFNFFLTLLTFFLGIMGPTLIIILYWGSNKVLISDKKLEFYIRKVLYFKVYWENLEYLNIFSEKFYDNKKRVKTGYVIEFKGLNIEKIIRLWCFPFRMDKQEIIISTIKNTIKGMDKPEIIENPIDDEIKIRSVECNEIDNFKKENR